MSFCPSGGRLPLAPDNVLYLALTTMTLVSLAMDFNGGMPSDSLMLFYQVQLYFFAGAQCLL